MYSQQTFLSDGPPHNIVHSHFLAIVQAHYLSGLTKKNCILVIVINNEPILSSMLAVGIVQDTFAGEPGEGERGRRSGDNWRLFLPPGPEILPVS